MVLDTAAFREQTDEKQAIAEVARQFAGERRRGI
jgi:hypothetical protein